MFAQKKLHLLACSILAVIGLSLAKPGVAQDDGAGGDRVSQMEKLFRQAVVLYTQGRYSEAQKAMRDLMDLEPRQELAARLVDEAGTDVMTKMMAEPRMGTQPSRIWDLYRKYYIGKLNDKEQIARMAQRLVDPATSADERTLLYLRFGELGHYGVPALAAYLGDQNREDFRSYARVAISRLGPVAVLPMLQMLDDKRLLSRQNAILTLTDLQPLDARAVPALKAILESPDESEVTKRFATRGLELITGLTADQLKPAYQYYYEAANRYYLERGASAEEAEMADGYIWHLNEQGELVSVKFPLWSWNEQMAEEMLLRGIALEPNQTDFYALAACIYGAQYTEVKDLLDIITEQPAKHYLSEEEKQELVEWDQKLIICRNLAAACGKFYVNEALLKVYRDMEKFPGHHKLPGVGVFLARLLKDLDPWGELLLTADQHGPEKEETLNYQETLSNLPSRIEIAPQAVTLPPFGKRQFKATAFDLAGKRISDAQFVWSTNAVNGSIDQNGLFSAGADAGTFSVVAEYVDPTGGKITRAEVQTAVVAAPVNDRMTRPAPRLSSPGPIPGEGDHLLRGSALVYGLDSPDENIQYACALSLAEINKYPQSWAGSDKVCKLLGRGVSEDKPLWILVVEEDHNIRNLMRRELEALGYGVTDAVSGWDAVVKARSFPPKDLAIVSERLRRDLNTESLKEELRGDIRTRYLPVGVLHDQAERTMMQARFGNAMPLVERENKGNDLKVAIEKIASLRAAESIPKRKAHEIAVECATTLNTLDLRWTNLVLADAVPHCVAALDNRPDDLRIPAASFIGKAQGGNMKEEASNRLVAIWNDKDNATPVRLAALKSIGEVSPEKYEAIYMSAQQEAEQDLKFQGAINFGKALRKNVALRDFLTKNRIDAEKKPKFGYRGSDEK